MKEKDICGNVMKKNLVFYILLCVCILFAGCAKDPIGESMKGAYVLITKSAGNPYNSHMANGFRMAIEESGNKAVVLEPDKTTAEEQISLIRTCIREKVLAISIAANDTTALDSVLQEAMDQGIQVSTVDSNTSKDSHAVFVNQVAAETLAECLMETVYELSGGAGSWAILSTTNQAGNQNAWIREMQGLMTQEKYQDLRLVSIAFGEDDAALSKTKVEEMIAQYPDLKVICSPTVVGMRAAAEVLAEKDLDIKLTGLGLPSEMADFMTGDDPLCPAMYLWNPISIGKLSAYVSMALTEGAITGAPGEAVCAPDDTQYRIVESVLGGSEVIVGEPLKFTSENISQWKEVF